MQNGRKSIALISDDPAVNALFESVMQFHRGAALSCCSGGLPDLNGTAQSLAREHDLLIFRTGGDLDRDVAALEELSALQDGAAEILAVADADMPFAGMRRLTSAGASDVLPDTVKPGELSDVIGKWLAPPRDAAPDRSRDGMVLPVCRSRGGIGATTVAVNLADCLTQRRGLRAKEPEYKVALVDLDLQFGTVGSFLNLPPNKSLFEMASEGFVPDGVFVEQSMTEAGPGLWVLASPAEFAPVNILQPQQIHALVTLLQARFDFVVIELPRAMVEWLTPVFEASSRTLLLTDSSVPSVSQARRLLDFLSEISVALQVETVVCHERKPLIQAGHHREAARLLQHEFRYWLPHDPAAAAAAADKGRALSSVAGRSALAKGIRRLAQDLITDRKALAGQTETVH